MKILIIEDEPKLAAFISKGLKQNGYTVDVSAHGSEGLEMAMVNSYDLVLLDIMLPGQNGFEIIKNIKGFKNEVPIIILSALTDTDQVIKGLDMGAVDYIKKPFDFDELLARIRVVTRRGSSAKITKLKTGSLEMDLVAREVRRDDHKISLTNREFNLLELLLRNINRVVTKTEIAEKIWEVNFDMGSNVIEVHMHQLRKKIDGEVDDKLITTRVGLGYIIEGMLIKS
ncbi:MAG: response regulator transcription factor [Bacteroidota bacterium]